MLNVINKGLNYSVLPHKLDNTLVLSEFKRFERTLVWKEFWKEKESDQALTKPESIFKVQKNNFPNYKTTSDLIHPLNRKKVSPNLTNNEFKALTDIVKLQKERKIVIKQCDKGAGVIILDHAEYLRSCYNHLSMTQSISGETENYYENVDENIFLQAKEKIKEVLDEAFDNEIINKEEHNAMNPIDKPPAKFYCTYKVHKDHEPGKAPPERPIISASGSCLENIGKYVQHHINDFGSLHETFLKDTPHFLNFINEINQNQSFPENTFLVTMDVSSLYTNIPHKEGINSLRESFFEQNEASDNSNFHKEFVLRLLEILLRNNIFEFNGKLFRQLIGAAMGSSPIPNYANNFMAKHIDNTIFSIIENISKEENISLKLFKRFLDDLIFIFTGQSKTLHKILTEANNIHPSIKLSMNHTTINEPDPCDCPKKDNIPFLDVSIYIQNQKICTDLYKKPTDRNLYLLPSSCHPSDCFKNIPFSLALRIVKICSDSNKRDLRLSELKQMLLDRDYDESIIDSAIRRVLNIPREKALQPKSENKKTQSRPVYVSTYDPRLPNIPAIINKHWRSQCFQDKNFKQTFPEPPIVAFKKQRNLRSFLIRAKVYPAQSQREQRILKGIYPCMKPCPTCPFIKLDKKISGPQFSWTLNGKYTCDTENIIYMIECNKEKCKKRYIGQSYRELSKRFAEHRGYVKNRVLSQPTGFHFNQPGHNISNMTVTILEKVKKKDELYRREREKHLINKFDTYKNGMNKKP